MDELLRTKYYVGNLDVKAKVKFIEDLMDSGCTLCNTLNEYVVKEWYQIFIMEDGEIVYGNKLDWLDYVECDFEERFV